ncbi:MAG: exodeoxyribonuclease VII large subunit [Caulobacterales bacterium]|nr:exodeoxyribonuclease VII large subunit [Caulobacterales bacterium]
MASEASSPPGDNAAPFSVSELSAALKRTVEERFGYVRLRGEISKVTRHASGHVYLTLKDENASIDGVIWRGVVSRLDCQPDQGLEVIVTGKITTYPARSSYQIVIDSMEPAGVGALLAQLERLKAQLRSEGLFDPARKRPIPEIPSVIGVITSPTGAVIRDILHRIRDRWPCRVLVWPCVVQGDQAARQVTQALRGFAALPEGGAIARPDVLIVARGGGSIEDLWPFNDEALARAVADCPLPVISAVGHETDTTLIDFVSDRRAPTPTAAAEMATPVLSELKAGTADAERRLQRAVGRSLETRRAALAGAAARLPSMADLFGRRDQRLDLASARLASGLRAHIAAHDRRLAAAAARLTPQGLMRPIVLQAERLTALDRRAVQALQRDIRDRELRLEGTARRLPSMQRPMRQAHERLDDLSGRATRSLDRTLTRQSERLDRLGRLLESLNPDGPLDRGFARIHNADGRLVRTAAALTAGEAVSLHFRDGDRQAVVEGDTPEMATAPKARAKQPKPPTTGQGDLF